MTSAELMKVIRLAHDLIAMSERGTHVTPNMLELSRALVAMQSRLASANLRIDESHVEVPIEREQERLMLELHGISDQIVKKHYLNVHFRAFKLAHESWQEHIRANAVAGSRECNSPAGAVLDDERGDVR